jgi:hypothetical protein
MGKPEEAEEGQNRAKRAKLKCLEPPKATVKSESMQMVIRKKFGFTCSMRKTVEQQKWSKKAVLISKKGQSLQF